ncbi:MAG TPA: TrkH family potassium uptake protein [Candidatus Sulfotelmatobacter sp.]|jgi:trk system potassium uptake protein TrkH|nr:TrkH family potassium uptake protein [Candidatus Sulfotelmatobacter sp.]
MVDFRPVLLVTGLALTVLALAMGIPAAVDAVHGDNDWLVFMASSSVTLLLGGLLVAANLAGRRKAFGIRQMFLLTVTGWLAASIAGALPFAFSRLHLSPTDAWFEAVSGVTASGSTVLRGLELLPPGILLWRAQLQWLGGAAALLMAALVLPELSIGGMQMFRLESNSAQGERVMGRGTKVAGQMMLVYVFLTGLLTLLLWAAGMSRFPALLHAMSTISGGGFSTSDGSVGAWHKPSVDWVILLGMLLSGAPFMVYLQIFQRRWRQALHNSQLRWYLGLFLLSAVGIGMWLLLTHGVKPLPSIRHGAVTAASVLTGTGHATLDWGSWGGLPVAILFFLSFVGGCAGSTAGGIKVFRLQILFTSAKVQLIRLLRPHSVVLPTYERKPVPDQVRESVLGFLFVYCLSFAVLSMLLGMVGLDFLTALTAATSALGNLGPGLTQTVGPMTSFMHLPDNAKWLLSAAMLYGRMEMFLVIVLFIPDFWKH